MYDDELARLKTPPHSVEAEQSVLGALMVPGSDFDAVVDLVSDTDFYLPAHQLIFGVMAKLAAANKPIDLTTVADSLTAEEMDRVGGFMYLADMARNTPSTANIRAYAAAVKERSNLRALIRIGSDIAESGYQADGRTSEQLIDEAQQQVMAVGERTADAGDIHVSASLKDYIEELERRHAAEGMAGLPTGFKDIDDRTNGFTPGDLVIVAGRPGSGKTTFAMSVAEHTAIQNQKAVLVFSMEMMRTQLIDRMVASVGKIPFALLRSGKVFDSEHSYAVMPAGNRIKNAPLYIDERGGLTVQQMRTTARRLHKKVPLSLVIIDYLQLAKGKGDNRVNEITGISQALKALAKELKVPVMALSQLSRKCEEQKRRPISSDLRDSGAIEQDADVIFLIYRDEVYNPDTKDIGIAEIHCTKLRNGEPGLDRLHSQLSMCRFNNLAHPYKAPEPDNPKRFDY